MIREAGSVLLIIGAAVVGPIEASGVIDGKWLGVSPHVCAPACRSETIAETCERVMREIGAVGSIIPAGQASCTVVEAWMMRKPIDACLPKPDYWLGNQQVLCIPAPSGLKR